MTNVTQVYQGGDRSHKLRKLQSSELDVKLPAILSADDGERPMAIEYFGGSHSALGMAPRTGYAVPGKDSIESTLGPRKQKPTVKDSIFASTNDGGLMGGIDSRINAGEKEMTTGWQFATQIEDDDDEQPSRFDFLNQMRDNNNKSALLIENKDIFPSMLDPAFEMD